MMMPQPRQPKQRPPSKQQPHQRPNAAPACQRLTTEQRPKTAPSVRTPMAFNCPGNKRGQQHLKQQPKAAPDTGMPLAPARNLENCVHNVTSTSNSTTPKTQTACSHHFTSTSNNISEQHAPAPPCPLLHQRPKLHAPCHLALKLAKQHPPAPQTASQRPAVNPLHQRPELHAP